MRYTDPDVDAQPNERIRRFRAWERRWGILQEDTSMMMLSGLGMMFYVLVWLVFLAVVVPILATVSVILWHIFAFFV